MKPPPFGTVLRKEAIGVTAMFLCVSPEESTGLKLDDEATMGEGRWIGLGLEADGNDAHYPEGGTAWLYRPEDWKVIK